MKNKVFVIIFFFAFSSALYSHGSDDIIKEAEALYHVGQPFRAIEEYNRALDNNLSPIERSVVITNIAEIFVAEKHWEDALSYCSRALDIVDIPPHVSAYTLYTKASALLGYAQSLSDEDISRAIALATEGVATIAEAQKKYIIAAELYGEDSAVSPKNFEDTKNLLQNLLSKLSQQNYEQWLSSLSFEEGCNTIAEHLESLIKETITLDNADANKTTKKHHLEGLGKETLPWRKVWDALDDKIPADEEASFREAQHHYSSALDLFDIDTIGESTEELIAAYDLLKKQQENNSDADNSDENQDNDNGNDNLDDLVDNDGGDEQDAENISPAEENSFNDVMFLLKQMDQEDTIHETNKKPIKQGQHPW
ncbi:MAG: hypothetical protein HN411_05190 [Waddliaceae bacterium]|jgi:tetratricopeptide (TPR) repeat protein|nr:hypothetical protein [Waddliaceae bacterium]MBT3579148.1 hypothetical protein [Waddliaceae bacterium]MBT4444304.1 hypothetical protein [Waddliaceae bacterium]MBT6928519.1 hypothetical protein [Waddliaceae bacterium]MBT7264857.1 hypothetical protein [Waddliaceae bacterium]